MICVKPGLNFACGSCLTVRDQSVLNDPAKACTAQADLTSAGTQQCASLFELRQGPRHGLYGQAKVVGDVAPGHRQCEGASAAQPLVNVDQERCHPFHGGAPTEQQHMVLGVTQATGGHVPKVARDIGVASGGALYALSPEDQDLCVRQCLGRMPVGLALLEAEQVARQVEAGDLSPTVVENLVGSDRTFDDPVDELGVLALAVDLLLAAVGKRSSNDLGATREEGNLASRRGRPRWWA